jgi:phosphoribosyl-AMP cyclohydrolase
MASILLGEKMSDLEETNELKIDFGKLAKATGSCDRIVPVAVQDIDSGEVILVTYTNETAFSKTVETRRAIFWSTSRNELWEKGKTSGNTFRVEEVLVNCEQNSLLYKVRPECGGICHTSNNDGSSRNCFYRRLDLDTMTLENLDP